MPHKNEPLRSPFFMIIYIATSIFSPPRSPRARDSTLYSVVVCLNRSRTVAELLLSLTLIAVTYKTTYQQVWFDWEACILFSKICRWICESQFPNGSIYGDHQCATVCWATWLGICIWSSHGDPVILGPGNWSYGPTELHDDTGHGSHIFAKIQWYIESQIPAASPWIQWWDCQDPHC